MTQPRNFHEEFAQDETPIVPSNEVFGRVLGGLLFTIGVLKWVVSDGMLSYAFMAVGVVFAALAFFKPALLTSPKSILLKIAPQIARVVNPILMGFIYLLCFVPGGLIMKLLRHDPLKRELDPYVATYWTKREKHDLPDPMKYQF